MNIKKYRLVILLGTVATVTVVACSKSFLNKTPIGTLSPSTLYDQKGIEGILIGAYSLLDGEGGNNSGWGSAASNWVYGSICADEAYKGSTPSDQGDITPLETWTATPTNSYPSNKWNTMYDGAQRANNVLNALSQASGIDASVVGEIRAEARFLRGFYHFELKKVFGNVPYVDETVGPTTKPEAVSNISGGNYVDIYPQIEADFKAAMDSLPNTQPEIGRATHWVAEAFLAKVYMFEGKYSDALPLLTDVINNGTTADGKPFDLVGYQMNFNPAAKNNVETVFAAQMSVNDGSGNAQAAGSGIANGNYGDLLNFPYNGGPSGCCGFFNPSQTLANAYKTDAAGLPLGMTTDPNTGAAVDAATSPYAGTLDPRIDWVMGRPNIDYIGWGPVPADGGWIRQDQGPNGRFVPKKSAYAKDQKGVYSSNESNFWGNTQLTANNVNLIRFADVLLWAAEALIQTGGDASVAEDYVNRVRTRAADPTGWVYANANYSSANSNYSPQTTPAGNYLVKTYPAGAFANKDYALKAIQYERRLEFAMEGHRFFDLVRWGIADVELNKYAAYEHGIQNCYQFYPTQPTFTKGKNELFPIPQDQIDALNADGNLNLKQNPNY